MTSIIDRLADIVKANMNQSTDDGTDPAETVDEYLGKLRQNLDDVRQKAQDVIADERRAAEAVEKNLQDARRYEDLAKAALLAGDEAKARELLQKKVDLDARGKSLQGAYEAIHEAAEKIRSLHDGLVDKIEQIDERKQSAVSRLDAAQASMLAAEAAGGGSSRDEANVFEAIGSMIRDAAHLEGQAQAGEGAWDDASRSREKPDADDSLKGDSSKGELLRGESLEELEDRFKELEAERAAEEAERAAEEAALAKLREELGM